MDWSIPMTLTGSGSITFNGSSGGVYENDPSACRGLSSKGPIRNPIDQRSQTDGAVKHTFRRDARPITIGGRFRPEAATDPAYYEERQEMKDELEEVLDSILNAEGSLTWTPLGDSNPREVGVFYYVELDTPFESHLVQRYVFTLIATDPEIT